MMVDVTIVPIDPWAIKVALARKKMRSKDLCELTGISQTNLCNMLRHGTVRVTTAGRIADALGVDVTEIMRKEVTA